MGGSNICHLERKRYDIGMSRVQTGLEVLLETPELVGGRRWALLANQAAATGDLDPAREVLRPGDVRRLIRIRYNTLDRLAEIECPVLIVHSPDDEVIPYNHGRRLFEAAPEPKMFLEIHGGHNEGFLISPGYRAGLEAFLEKYGP